MKAGSPALTLGFENFPMDQFGVSSPRLKAIAKTPALPSPKASRGPVPATQPVTRWRGATLRALAGEELSALGVARDAAGVLVADAPADSDAAKAGLRTGDFVQAVNGQPVRSAQDLVARLREAPAGQRVKLDIVRNQKREPLELPAP